MESKTGSQCHWAQGGKIGSLLVGGRLGVGEGAVARPHGETVAGSAIEDGHDVQGLGDVVAGGSRALEGEMRRGMGEGRSGEGGRRERRTST